MTSSEAPALLPSRQWSCSSLLQGQAYMATQKFQLDSSLSLDEKLDASWFMKITVGIFGCYLTKLPKTPKHKLYKPYNYMACSGCKEANTVASSGATGAATDSTPSG